MAYSKRAQNVERPKPLRIKTGDDVIVISGKGHDSKTPRKVLGTLPAEGKVIVEGINIMRERKKARGGSSRASGINQEAAVEKPFPIQASKVMLVDPKSAKATRVKMVKQGDKRVRVAVKSGETI